MAIIKNKQVIPLIGTLMSDFLTEDSDNSSSPD